MSVAFEKQNPFPGLRPFKTEESTLFFGRDDQIGEALDRMLRQRLLAVVGVSGCGKSSLVFAGMIPALEMGLAGDPETHWLVATMRPGDGPLRELARCLGYGEALAERTYGLQEAAEANLPAGHNLLLVVDQFEELFPFRDRKLRAGGGSEADLFVSYLLRAAQDQAGRVYVLLTMRSDYLGECAKFHGLPEALNDGQYLVPRMTRQQLEAAIEGPLESVGVTMHPALTQELLNQCDEEPDNLPLLQHLLRRAFEEWCVRGGQGAVTAEIATSVGGLTGALDQDAEAVCAGLSAEELRATEILFKRITESRRQAERNEEDRPVRRPQTVADLATLAQVDEKAIRDLVERFERRGLLVVRQTDQGDKVDLPHECLCLRWRRLKEWIQAEAEDAKKLRFLSDATERKAPLGGLALAEAVAWQQSGRLQAAWCRRYLALGQIAEVTAWVKESHKDFTEAAERERLSREEEQKREFERQREESHSRGMRNVLAVFGVMAVACVLLAIWALGQRVAAQANSRLAEEKSKLATSESGLAVRSAAEARSEKTKAEEAKVAADIDREKALQATARALESERRAEHNAALFLSAQMASYSEAVFREDPSGLERAALLAVESLLWYPSPDGEKALRQSAGLLPGRYETSQHVPSKAVALSPDAKWVATDQSLDETATGKQKPMRTLGSQVRVLALGLDGKRIAIQSEDGRVFRLIDTASGETLKQFAPGGSITAAALSYDGRMLALGVDCAHGDPCPSPDKLSVNSVRVVDLSTLETMASLNVSNLPTRALAFSSDGKRLAVGGDDQFARVLSIDPRAEVSRLLHQGKVLALAFSRNGKWLATGGDDKTAHLMDIASGRELARLGHQGAVRAVAFTPNNEQVRTWADDGTARLMNVSVPAKSVPLGNPDEANAAVFSPDGKRIAIGSVNNYARVISAATMELVREIPHRDEVYALAFSADGKLLTTRTKGKTVRVTNLETGHTVREQADQRLAYSLAFSPNGKLMAVGGDDNIAPVTNLASGELVSTAKHGAGIYGVAFSPDSKLLLTGSEDHTSVVWYVESGMPFSWKVELPGRVYAAAFSADGKWVAAGGGAIAIVTDLASGKPVHRIDLGAGILGAARFSDDKKWLETIHQISETDKGLLYMRHSLDTQYLIGETCGKLSRNLSWGEWEQYGKGVPYQRACENLPYPPDLPKDQTASPR